ncbi:YigZ family protein [Sulfurimonas sp. HSL3-7]|uniref:YigZ family protein n=1 Tax=Sulfonitrofixus jiaomeiensis TaxID=3131938 RepID=UPI0031F98A25
MFTVTDHTHEMLIEKQSKFIAHLIPYGIYDEVLASLRAEHPKARHFVTAFRYINEFDQVVEGSSDDGEPKGTSGKPTLAVLQGSELINVAVITVRYFGGTKLGTGGLVRAYSDAANLAVNAANLVPYQKENLLVVACAYSDIGKVDYILEKLGVKVTEKEFDAVGEVMHLQAPQESLDAFLEEAKRLVTIVSA